MPKASPRMSDLVGSEAGTREQQAARWRVFAVLAAQQGQPVRALRLAGAGAAHRPGINLGGAEQAWLDRMLAPARHALAETAQAAAWAAGQAMTLEQAVAYALSDEAD